MLSLNWLDEGKSTKCNEVRNKRHNINNYWLARSEEILDGAFIDNQYGKEIYVIISLDIMLKFKNIINDFI